MERRDYLEKEIEKMRAVLQKIFRMRVDRDEEIREVVSSELNHYFDVSLQQLQQMSEDEFRIFIRSKNPSLTDFIGHLLHASVDPDNHLSETDRHTLRKTLIAWETWEAKTRTFDPQLVAAKEEIVTLLNPN